MDEDRQREIADGGESVYLFNQGVHLVLSCQAAAQTSPDVDLDQRSGRPQPPPRDSCETSTLI